VFRMKISPPSLDSKSKLNSSVFVSLQLLVPLAGENRKSVFFSRNKLNMKDLPFGNTYLNPSDIQSTSACGP
jgi:hypothetical protein